MLSYDSVTSAGADLPHDLGAGDDVVVAVEDGAQARDLLREATGRDCGYIGLVAPEREAIQALLALSKDRIPRARLDRVAAPAGVDIGATTPGERAVAVAAELVARRRPQAAPTGRSSAKGKSGPRNGHGGGGTGTPRGGRNRSAS
jgi:xanthine/CO dehydrogenase XdhC/CoxF family maturation factor